MAYELLFDAGHKVLMARFSGIATDRDVQGMTAAARRFVERHGACPAIADFSSIESFAVTGEFVRALAKTPAVVTGHRRVLVGASDAVFGTLRMFEMHQAPDEGEVSVVRSLARAYELLGVAKPDFQPVTNL